MSALLAVSAARAQQQDGTCAVGGHVRAEASAVRELVDRAARRSPTIRQLLDGLDASDVTVYIRIRAFSVVDLDGHIGWLGASRGHRYLLIELACGRTERALFETLGHELRHASEIAGEPSIVDARSLAAHYARIGVRTSGDGPPQTFETEGARDTGRRVRRELLDAGARHPWTSK